MNSIDQAVEALARGELIVFPTDTVYGIAARPDNASAIERIFAAKGRPETKPLPILGASLAALKSVAAFDDRATRLAWEWWPGPLTLVLCRAQGFDHDLGGADPNIAVRVPASGVALELLDRAGPLAVTSANRSGEPSAATVEAAEAAFGDSVAVYLDGGPSEGKPSTILNLAASEPEFLRIGPITLAELDDLLRQISSP
jgi:tRNA threonylcarbamoyl adenosine modification protein (Sua5/YciO/YrdC/YwlC family)